MFGYFLCVILVAFTASAYAGQYDEEPFNSGWRINADNDLLTGLSTDRDYTGGIAVTLSGERAREYPVSIDAWRAGIDRLTGFPRQYQADSHMSFHSQQYGMTLFTPDDIENSRPVYEDRPYASLLFMSNTEYTVVPERDFAYVSILSIGFLGLDLAEDIQKSLHGVTGSDVPNGWQHQVSAGGEPTAMLTYGMQNSVYDSANQQFKFEYEANLGFITDVNTGFSWRWGRINSPWWAHNSYQSKYMQQSMPLFSSFENEAPNEFYFYAGARLNLRIYNSLLQGQFRHSEVRVSSGDLERLVAEYRFGVTREFAKKYYASFFIQGHTEEFKGPKSRSAAWAGLVLSRVY